LESFLSSLERDIIEIPVCRWPPATSNFGRSRRLSASSSLNQGDPENRGTAVETSLLCRTEPAILLFVANAGTVGCNNWPFDSRHVEFRLPVR
jgi:hypothetical protein